MTRYLTGILTLLFCLAPALAHAEDEGATGRLHLRTRTLILGTGGVAPGIGPTSPLLQWVELTGTDLADRHVSVHTSLWGGASAGEAKDRVSGSTLFGDVTELYVRARDPKGSWQATAGRQLLRVAPGLARFGHIDGLALKGQHRRLRVDVYGGQIVDPRLSNLGGLAQGDWLVGGRLGAHRWSTIDLGVSYVQARHGGEVSRSFLGADLAWYLHRNLDVVGDVSVDTREQALAEAELMARWRAAERVTIVAGATQARPGLLIDQSSIFSVFSRGDYASGWVEGHWAPTDTWAFNARYGANFFPDDDGLGVNTTPGHEGSVGATTWLRRDLWLRVGLERVPTVDGGWWGGRVAARWNWDPTRSVAAEVYTILADDAALPTAGAGRDSIAGRLMGNWAINDAIELGVGGEVGRTVLADLDARVWLHLVTDLDLWEGAR